jgi:hypothetical protein
MIFRYLAFLALFPLQIINICDVIVIKSHGNLSVVSLSNFLDIVGFEIDFKKNLKKYRAFLRAVIELGDQDLKFGNGKVESEFLCVIGLK